MRIGEEGPGLRFPILSRSSCGGTEVRGEDGFRSKHLCNHTFGNQQRTISGSHCDVAAANHQRNGQRSLHERQLYNLYRFACNLSFATYDLFPDLAGQPGQATLLTNPNTVVVYVDSHTQQLNSNPVANGSVVRFNGLIFNGNGTLRMDGALTSDGVAE